MCFSGAIRPDNDVETAGKLQLGIPEDSEILDLKRVEHQKIVPFGSTSIDFYGKTSSTSPGPQHTLSDSHMDGFGPRLIPGKVHPASQAALAMGV